MRIVILFLNLAFVALMLVYLAAMVISLLSNRYRLRKAAKNIACMDLVSRPLSTKEAAACKKIYPRFAKRIPADARVITVSGGYGYTTISGRYGAESRMQHTIGPLPFLFLQCMESSLYEEQDNTAELILLSNGTALPVSLNSTWTVHQEAAARDALKKGQFAAVAAGASKLVDRHEPPPVREYLMYHPPLRLAASVILLIGIILLLTWNHESPIILLYAGTAGTAVSFLWILVPGGVLAAKKTSLVRLSGTAVFRGSRIMVDRFLLQVLPKGYTHIEDGKPVVLEGWIHPKNHDVFCTATIHTPYGETLWSLKKNHWSRNWMRFLIPLIVTTLAVLIYTDVNSSGTIAKDYLNWRKHGQTVRTFDSLSRLAEELKTPGGVPAGSILNLENFAILEDPSRADTEYAYRIMDRKSAEPPDFSEARKRAAQLSRLIRTPLGTSIFIGTNYPETRLWYISLYIDQFTSNESPADFAEAFPDSKHFTSFLEAATAYEAAGFTGSTDSLLHSWTAFLREETDTINELITNEVTRALQNKTGVPITTDYFTPDASISIPWSYLEESHFDPYRIPSLSRRNFGRSEPRESWIAETPRFEERLNELKELYTYFPNTTDGSPIAFVTGSGRTSNGEPLLELSFSRYRIERALEQEDKLMLLLALAAVCAVLAAAMSGCILREIVSKYLNTKD